MNKSIYYYGLVAVTSLLIGIAIGFALLKTGTKKTDIQMKFGSNELKINLDQDLSDPATMLGQLFSEDFSRIGTIDWLKTNQKLYGPEDPDIVPQFASLPYKHPVSEGLRDIRLRRVGPWAYQVDTIQVGIPEIEDQPPKRSANVCENGKFFARKIRIKTLHEDQFIELEATGKHSCPDRWDFPDLQLHRADAKKLFGSTKFSKYQPAIVLIVKEE